MTTLASSTTFTSADCSPELAAKAARAGSSVSPAWLAAKAALDEQGGWHCLDTKAQKVLGYTYHKVTTTAPFFHGAWIYEAPDGTTTLVVVDHNDIKKSPVRGRVSKQA